VGGGGGGGVCFGGGGGGGGEFCRGFEVDFLFFLCFSFFLFFFFFFFYLPRFFFSFFGGGWREFFFLARVFSGAAEGVLQIFRFFFFCFLMFIRSSVLGQGWDGGTLHDLLPLTVQRGPVHGSRRFVSAAGEDPAKGSPILLITSPSTSATQKGNSGEDETLPRSSPKSGI